MQFFFVEVLVDCEKRLDLIIKQQDTDTFKTEELG